MTDTLTKTPVTITESALKQLSKIKSDQNISDENGIRIGVKGGGCSGFTYILGFDSIKENDQIYEIGGMKILMEKSHGLYLLGMEIDWVDGLDNRGFSFNNPNATSTCGCGTSFSA